MRDTDLRVVFIGGFGRSGSTLLECLLAQLDEVVVLGELEHLWERGVEGNQLCACGAPFQECPFWGEVGSLAFGGWENVDVERVLTLKDQVARQRRLAMTLRRTPPDRVMRGILEYTSYHRRIYEAARTVSGAEVIVDSSKFPPMAVALAHDEAVDLRVLHIVRDSRGVAFSWSKTVARPETSTGEPMPRYSPVYSSIQWLSHNLAIDGLPRLGRPVVRLRYEDLVKLPVPSVSEAWRDLELPGSGMLPMIDTHTVELLPTHSVAGNPMRFRRGVTELRSDQEWETRMDARDRRIVTALTYPVLIRYGYPVRQR